MAEAKRAGDQAPRPPGEAQASITRSLVAVEQQGRNFPASISMRFGLGFAKSHVFVTGQCPVMKYNRGLMHAILNDKVTIAKNVNATPIALTDAPQGYADFDSGVAKKFVLDPHGMIKA